MSGAESHPVPTIIALAQAHPALTFLDKLPLRLACADTASLLCSRETEAVRLG